MKKGVNAIVALVMSTLLMMTLTSSTVSAVTILSGDDVINIKDTYFLSQLISNNGADLNKDGKISVKEMEGLSRLNLYDYNSQITDITGLEYAKNLVSIYFSGVLLNDLDALKNMTKLQSLTISSNYSTKVNSLDISGLVGLKELKNVRLYNNTISDINDLQALTQLEDLSLSCNTLTDISNLKYLTNLKSLSIVGNSISDISDLKGLTQLESLELGDNNISDINVLKDLINLRYISLGNNKITDVSPLSGLSNLNSISLEYNQISDISPLKNLINLKSLSIYGNNVSDVDKFAFVKISYEEMFKGGQYYCGVLPNGILYGVTVSSDDKDIISISNNYITALKEGEATIKLQYGTLSKSFKVKVNGIDANQPLEANSTVTAQFDGNGALNSKGELWNLSDNGPKVAMSNVKKYVANNVYEGEGYNRDNALSNKLAIDNNDTLWSWGVDKNTDNGTMGFQDNKEEMKNIKYVDTRYAVTNNNELFDYCTDQPRLLDNVKEIKRISDSNDVVSWRINLGTQVLKNDNTLWVRRDVKIGDATSAFVQVDSSVLELTDSNGYIKKDGTYWKWDGVATGNLTFKKIADNVSAVKSGFIVNADNTVISPFDNSTVSTTGLSYVKRYGYGSESYGASYLVDKNNTLWNYDGSKTTLISNNFKKFTESGFIKTDGNVYNYYNEPMDYIKTLNANPGDFTLGKDNTLYMSGIKILTNVKDLYQPGYYYNNGTYALRTDGSIWEVGDRLPTKIVNIDYDSNRDGVIDILDLANIGSSYNAISTSVKYNKNCDFNKDNIIDIYDIVSFSKKLKS